MQCDMLRAKNVQDKSFGINNVKRQTIYFYLQTSPNWLKSYLLETKSKVAVSNGDMDTAVKEKKMKLVTKQMEMKKLKNKKSKEKPQQFASSLVSLL